MYEKSGWFSAQYAVSGLHLYVCGESVQIFMDWGNDEVCTEGAAADQQTWCELAFKGTILGFSSLCLWSKHVSLSKLSPVDKI